ncbi:P-loop containing nucleoside triphosphate hydrolase protein [Xylariaceae sp. FL0255]|nr:P-loop containing nucleoside triphosphate hydrolase protein [Xylariaceae sp. FL0255]
MADPLSIAASIAGLIGLSIQIYDILTRLSPCVLNSIQSAHDLLLTNCEIRMTLNSLSNLSNELLRYSPTRRALIQLDHLILYLTQMTLTYQGLKECIDIWVRVAGKQLLKRLKLVGLGKRISIFIIKIREHKTSMSLITNILQCESDMEARRDSMSLHRMMQRVVDENEQLHTLILQQRSFFINSNSLAFDMPLRNLTVPEMPAVEDSNQRPRRVHYNAVLPPITDERISDHRVVSRRAPAMNSFFDAHDSTDELHLRPSFEVVLEQTRVYSRVSRVECDASFTTDKTTSDASTILSGLSLDQISSLSVIALPITQADIGNNHYFTESQMTKMSRMVLRVDGYYRISMLGRCAVGKTSLINQVFPHSPDVGLPALSTIDYSTLLQHDGRTSYLRVTDAPGLTGTNAAAFREVVQHAEGFLLVYSVTDLQSFYDIRLLYEQVKHIKQWSHDRPAPVVIVGTKADQKHMRKVTQASSFTLAQQLQCPFYESNYRAGGNVANLPFIDIVRRMWLGRPAHRRDVGEFVEPNELNVEDEQMSSYRYA